jgi:toxin ParE1/3/4
VTELGFHPEAEAEYQESISFYAGEAPYGIEEAFVAEAESILGEIRRRVLRRFPYVIYYRLEREGSLVVVYAVMHCSREPGVWMHRVSGVTGRQAGAG